MTERLSKVSGRRVWMITAIIAALLLLVPVGATTAYLTSVKDAPTTTGGTGRWCTVPDPAQHPNVYRLNAFPSVAHSTGTSRMIIVPVVRNGAFGPGGGDGQLGVRTWSCASSGLPSDSTLKVTSWRNASGAGSIVWKPQTSNLASSRLDPTTGLGANLSDLHRRGSNGSPLSGSARERYSWIISSGRSKSTPNATATCDVVILTENCRVVVEPAPTFPNAFPYDTGRTANNSQPYLATGYWKDSGQWSGKFATLPTALDVKLAPYANNIASTDGRQVQWVVMEWWGSTEPTEDMVLEVFVR